MERSRESWKKEEKNSREDLEKKNVSRENNKKKGETSFPFLFTPSFLSLSLPSQKQKKSTNRRHDLLHQIAPPTDLPMRGLVAGLARRVGCERGQRFFNFPRLVVAKVRLQRRQASLGRNRLRARPHVR